MLSVRHGERELHAEVGSAHYDYVRLVRRSALGLLYLGLLQRSG